MKHFITSISFVLFSQVAVADSFCEYDKGFIGTEAIGFIQPFSMAWHTHEAGTNECFITVRSEPNLYARAIAYDVPCFDIQPLPSPYIYTPETVPADHNPAENEYYSFMVFAETSRFIESRLRDGTPVFIEKPATYKPRFTHTNAIGIYGLTSSEKFYSAPDFKAETHAPDYQGEIQQEFMSLMIEDPDFDPKQASAYMANTPAKNSLNVWTVDFSYTVTDIVTDPEGRQWYKTDEQIKLDLLGETYPKLQEAYGDIDHPEAGSSIVSPVLRTVYIPFRDLEGQVVNVFLPGPYCD